MRKSRSKVPKPAHLNKQEALTQQMGKVVQVNLLKGIKTWRDKISPDALHKAWQSRDYKKLEKVIPWDKLPSELKEVDGFEEKSLNKTAAFEIQGLPAPIKNNLRWDTKNPEITKYLDKQSGERITLIKDSTMETLRQSVKNTYDKGWTPRDVANSIKDNIGLLPQHARAVDNYRNGLISEGMKKDMAIELSSKYAEKLLNYRAMMIARTETRLANQYGQLSVWNAAKKQGLMDGAKKTWVVDGNPCDICDPMDGVSVDIDDVWDLDTGDEVDVPTESHPHCECNMVITFGDDDE